MSVTYDGPDEHPIPHAGAAGAPETPFDDEGPLPVPTGEELLCHRVNAVLDRLVAISDNQAAIDRAMQDVLYRQGVITCHIRAIKYHLEEDLP